MSAKKAGRFGFDFWFDAVVTALLVLICIVVLYPLYFTVIASVSDPMAVTSGQALLRPVGLNFKSYQKIFEDARIWSGYWNTIRYTFFGTMVGLALTVPAGYALSRKELAGRKMIQKLMVFTMYFQGGLIPTYLVVQKLHLINTPYVLMILGSFTVFNLIIARSFFETTIPAELQEAAEIDGCNQFRFFVSIVLPLSRAIVAVVALYYVVGHWNSFFNALIYVSEEKLYPLQLILRDLLLSSHMLVADGTGDPDTIREMETMALSIKYGIIIVASVPVLIVYPFLQKYFVKGVMIGSIKG